MIGGKSMREVFGALRRFAAHDFHVLITGESGTGKELAARAVHDSSHRSRGAFVAVNCAALSESLIESELFGHVKGAFTGANTDHSGAFQQAKHGTLFLDELGELSLSAQSKLLRALESGEVRRVGSSKVEFPDVRIIAATNADLNRKVQQGLFRADLLYRLGVLSIRLPPLRARIEDLPMLCRRIAKSLNPKIQLHDCALQIMKSHRWPGNVRELRNVITRAYVLAGEMNIRAEHISLRNLIGPQASAHRHMDPMEFDKDNLKELLRRHRGNRSAVARELGIARTTLLYRLKCLKLAE
jgi:transcriptional regulator with PAS, ATPase and Fis domain